MSQLSGQRATSPSSTSREGAGQSALHPSSHKALLLLTWELGCDQEKGVAQGLAPHTPLLPPLQGCFAESPNFLGGSASTGSMTSPHHTLQFVLGPDTQGGRGQSCHRAAMRVPVFVIWGQSYLLVILPCSVRSIEYSSFIDYKKLHKSGKYLQALQGRWGLKHAPNTDSHTLTPALTHTPAQTYSHVNTQLLCQPLLSAPCTVPRCVPPQHPSHFPSQRLAFCKPPGA